MTVTITFTDEEFDALYDCVLEDTTDASDEDYNSMIGKLIKAACAPTEKPDTTKLWEALKGVIGT